MWCVLVVCASVTTFHFFFFKLFAGTDVNPLAFCNDPCMKTVDDCVGLFRIKVDSSKEFLPLDLPGLLAPAEMLVPRVW